MKKLLAILVVLTMAIVSVQALAQDPCIDCKDDGNQAYYNGVPVDIATSATIGGSGGSIGGPDSPIIKCKWEYDMDVVIPAEVCPPCADPCETDGYHHDACACTEGLQVKPILGNTVTVGYYAVVTDSSGIGTVSHIYADIWHPDGTFKYQIELFPVGFNTVYSNAEALADWDHVTTHHSDLITYLNIETYGNDEIYDELWENLAYLYYGEAEISYCQPGGCYYVGVRAHDTYNTWCPYLYNKFTYIPTSAVELDFNTLNYGTLTIPSSDPKWIGGDHDMLTAAKPTVKNIGNTPVDLYVWQDDMKFGQTAGAWNVMFDARLGAPGENDVVEYYPYENITGYPGVRIPGILPLCTEDKMDFSIHAFKGMPGYVFTGKMDLYAFIDGTPIWQTPIQFKGNAPLGVPNPYAGPI